MKTIKKLLLLPTIALVIMSFTQCSSAQFDKKAPATITEAFYQDWVGGRPGSKGTLVTIKLNAPETTKTFDSLFFNGKVVKLESTLIKNELTLTGNFMTLTNPKDIIVHADPKEEFGNTPPQLAAKIPFELEENQAVISYFLRNKKRYFKLENIKKRKTLYYQ